MSKKNLFSDLLGSADEQFCISRTFISSSTDIPLHYHDYAEIFWISEGRGFHLVNGQSIPIEKGTLIFIRPEDTHTFKLNLSGSRMGITNLSLSKKNMEFYLRRYSSYVHPHASQLPFTTQLPPAVQGRLSSLADNIFAGPRDILHLDLLILFIFNNLHYPVTDNQCMPHWLAYALKNYKTSELFVQGIKGFVGLTGKSTDHVNKELQNFLHQSLTETINKARLKYAANQLIQTNCPIKTITSECGYATVNYFHRIFKKYYGVTPSEYRNRYMRVL
ncbi:MAG: AraC family transcriptional regulator [Bacteroidota bacterium]|nr:AraC family transcriptional regulator [Bacteroidota bacterium]MDP4275411.1 AraC family transcriptional regulator [Bacteroidota bacterium]